ncbi:hypothetical protein GCM10010121_100350 [Streptomyces brasiliensis]|uniref:Uncharacterized protein n=1 Tax=Streptomyces brasiliensis TaxID=1954 RepID=A0A917UQ11_9ACTN|nr:hypothetical protein GCM10010121_100350 [Streptomyces brasiliensis]
MASVLGLLEERERAARKRVEELQKPPLTLSLYHEHPIEHSPQAHDRRRPDKQTSMPICPACNGPLKAGAFVGSS